jgi:hypothetical protein
LLGRAERELYTVETKHGFWAEHAGGAVLNFFGRVLSRRHSLIFYGLLSLLNNFTDA